MHISEQDRNRDVRQVSRFAAKMRKGLDEFTDEEQGCEMPEIRLAPAGSHQRQIQKRVVGDRDVDEGGEVGGIHGPRLEMPDVAVDEELGGVGSPRCASPANELRAEFFDAVDAEGGVQEGLRMVVEDGLPAVAQAPANDKVIIVNSEGAGRAIKPHFIQERVCEGRSLRDIGAHEAATAGDDEDAFVEVAGRGAFEVVAFEVDDSDIVYHIFDAV